MNHPLIMELQYMEDKEKIEQAVKNAKVSIKTREFFIGLLVEFTYL